MKKYNLFIFSSRVPAGELQLRSAAGQGSGSLLSGRHWRREHKRGELLAHPGSALATHEEVRASRKAARRPPLWMRPQFQPACYLSGTRLWFCQSWVTGRGLEIRSSWTGSTPRWASNERTHRSTASRCVCETKWWVIRKLHVRLNLFICSQDKLISTSLPVIDLIDVLAPGAVNWDMVKKGVKGKLDEEEKNNNAK